MAIGRLLLVGIVRLRLRADGSRSLLLHVGLLGGVGLLLLIRVVAIRLRLGLRRLAGVWRGRWVGPVVVLGIAHGERQRRRATCEMDEVVVGIVGMKARALPFDAGAW